MRAPASRTPRATPRPASASTSRPTAATPGRSFPAATSSRTARSPTMTLDKDGQPARRHRERDSRRQLRDRRSIGCPTPTRLRRPRRLPADRGDVHAAARRPTSAARPRSRSIRTTRTSSTSPVRRGRLALARQRRDVDADQDRAQPGTATTDRAEFALNEAAGRQDADVRRRRQQRALAAPASSAPTTQPARPVFTDMTTPQNIGYCTAQCWYDNVVYSPPGNPDASTWAGSTTHVRRASRRSSERPRASCYSTDGGATSAT